jgi:hypothetical protein
MLIPLPKDVMARLSYPIIEEYSNIIMAYRFLSSFSCLRSMHVKIKLNFSIFLRFGPRSREGRATPMHYLTTIISKLPGGAGETEGWK